MVSSPKPNGGVYPLGASSRQRPIKNQQRPIRSNNPTAPFFHHSLSNLGEDSYPHYTVPNSGLGGARPADTGYSPTEDEDLAPRI